MLIKSVNIKKVIFELLNRPKFLGSKWTFFLSFKNMDDRETHARCFLKVKIKDYLVMIDGEKNLRSTSQRMMITHLVVY